MTQNSAQFSQLDFCEKKNLKEDNISKSTQAFSKFRNDLKKFEEIGKKGKTNYKNFPIEVELLEFLIKNCHDFSLKIVAYIIKGFFISLNRQYCIYFREIKKFLYKKFGLTDNSTTKSKKINNSNEIEDDNNIEEEENEKDEFILNNFSLFSENSFFERFLSNSNMKTQLENTLKKLSGSFKSFDFNKLSPEETKDFLRSLIINTSQNNNNNNEIIANKFMQSFENKETKDFCNYLGIDFNNLLEEDENDYNNNIFPINEDNNLNYNENFFQFNEKKLLKFNKNLYKKNNIIEFDKDTILNKIMNTKIENDTEEAFLKNIKLIKRKLRINNFNVSLQNKLKNILMNQKNKYDHFKNYNFFNTYSFSGLASNLNLLGFGFYNINNGNKNNDINNSIEIMRENEDNDSLNCSIDKIINFNSKSKIKKIKNKNITQISNFKLNLSLFSSQFSQNSFHTMNYYNNNNDFDLLENEEKKINNINNIQETIFAIFKILKNYQDFSVNNLCKRIEEFDKSKNIFELYKNENEKMTFVFYNMLIVCQNKGIQLKQTDLCGNIFLTK